MLLEALWCILPAYFANSSAVLWGGGTPLDMGLRLPDGARFLGDGKTFRGFLGGAATGVLVAVALNAVSGAAGMPGIPLLSAVGLSVGALSGDVSASFLKRRIGLGRGRPMPGLDQLDFLAGGLLLTWLLTPAWFSSVYGAFEVLFVAALTPLVHVSVNLFAYKVGLKGEPW